MDAFSLHWKMQSSMRRVKEQSEHITNPFCATRDITPLQLRILLTLHFEGPQSISGLARSTCMAGANNSALCKRLDGEGLVLRQRNEEDERQVNVSLTPKGMKLVQDFLREASGSLERLECRFNQEDTRIIMAGLDRLIAVLDKSDEKETEAI